MKKQLLKELSHIAAYFLTEKQIHALFSME